MIGQGCVWFVRDRLIDRADGLALIAARLAVAAHRRVDDQKPRGVSCRARSLSRSRSFSRCNRSFSSCKCSFCCRNPLFSALNASISSCLSVSRLTIAALSKRAWLSPGITAGTSSNRFAGWKREVLHRIGITQIRVVRGVFRENGAFDGGRDFHVKVRHICISTKLLK